MIGWRCQDWEWRRGIGGQREGSEGECGLGRWMFLIYDVIIRWLVLVLMEGDIY